MCKVLYLLGLLTFVFIPSAFAFEPITMTAALAGLTAAAGTAGVGAGLWGLFGGGKKKSSQDDPLAGIRLQLQNLASQVPGLVSRQKELIGKEYDTTRTEGKQAIGEDVYATRGLSGGTSIFSRLETELLDKLAKSQAESELAAEMGGLQMQSNILSGAGRLAAEEQPEEPSIWANIAGGVGSLLGQELGYKKLEDIINPPTGKQYGYDKGIEETPDWYKNIKLTPA